MVTARLDEPIGEQQLRLWPGILAVSLQLILRYAVPAVVPETGLFGVLASIVLGFLVIIWWTFFSRAPALERWGGLALIVVAMTLTPLLLHESIATGMMGFMFLLYSIPVVSLALVVWAVATRNLSAPLRRTSMIVAIVLACGGWTLLRTDGMTGGGAAQFAWRWSPTHEAKLLANAKAGTAPLPVRSPLKTEVPTAPRVTEERDPAVQAPPGSQESATEPPAAWPGFRGAGRDGVVRGVRIDTAWSSSPPVEVWRRPVGPGWSSFAVQGDLIYTQEQRGDDELVACYRLSTGAPVWVHRDSTRFWESNAGAGPRGTPTVHNSRLFSLGATGTLNAFNAADGRLLWSRNLASDTGIEIPGWGFSSSPLVVEDTVIVAAAGKLAAYDFATGQPRWFGDAKASTYSSPHLYTVSGAPQVLMLSGTGATSVAPQDGRVLWEHEWKGSTILQPAILPDGDILITTSDAAGGMGTRRLAISNAASRWSAAERWTSRGLKPYFNDFVVHKGYAFGFDGRILSCIDLQNGDRKWKGGRFGHGQMLLLADQDLLLVVTEEGEVVLVEARPEEFTERARFKAIEGKTWNHPALVGDLLLVRNGQEMAAFRLSTQQR